MTQTLTTERSNISIEDLRIFLMEVNDEIAGAHPETRDTKISARLLRDILTELLANREAQPVAFLSKGDVDTNQPHILARRYQSLACTMPVYTAPPAPEVPKELVEEPGTWKTPDVAFGWNACRAAMLAQPVSQGCKLADSSGGWIEHDGDSIPKSLDRNALVYLKTRGKELEFPYPAGIVRWVHFNNDFDIVAYKMAAAPEGGNDA